MTIDHEIPNRTPRRLGVLLAAGTVAFGAMTLAAPSAAATGFSDGCTAVHGIPASHTLSRPKNGGDIEETCTFLNDVGGVAWTVYNYSSSTPKPVPGGAIQEPPRPTKGGPILTTVVEIPGG